nr:hypothetical protein [Gammaproteobacteria bacterium]
MSNITEQRVRLIRGYAASYNNLADFKARELLKESLSIQKEKLDLQEQFAENFENALPPQKVIGYFQIENKPRAIVDAELVGEIPLARVPDA